jgi:hypothetical protein
VIVIKIISGARTDRLEREPRIHRILEVLVMISPLSGISAAEIVPYDNLFVIEIGCDDEDIFNKILSR